MKIPKYILPIIVFSQFCGTSLWFSGNAIMPELVVYFNLQTTALAHLTSAVQLGFIVGTLVFAILSLADRYSPSIVFVASAFIAAACNYGVIWRGNSLETLLLLRFLTGFFLAGIYPVGMKIAADYYDKGLGRSLGFLVGALVLGTAFPHILRNLLSSFPWKIVMTATSGIAILGGLLLALSVPDGPYRIKGTVLHMKEIPKLFNNPSFKDAAIGYFGHMWELYAFWAFIPLILTTYNDHQLDHSIPVHSGSFIIIGIGAIACILGGYISEKLGVRRVAKMSLFLSMMCCLLSPIIYHTTSSILVITFLCFWGMVVIADSPLFSTLVAHNAPASSRGTGITIVTCIGFAVTIVSIQLLQLAQEYISLPYVLPLLGIGPLIGLYKLR